MKKLALIIQLSLAALLITTTSHAGVGLKIHLDGLEPLHPDYVFEGWIITSDGPVSTGTFHVTPGGVPQPAVFPLEPAVANAAEAFVLTIEPAIDHDPEPSHVHYLGGDFSGNTAHISVSHHAALGHDFLSASGTYILETPTTSMISDDYNQGIWFLDPSAGPGASLDLPELPEGWMYEGWVVGSNGPKTTGKFTMTEGDDSDSGGMYAGPDSAPPFPGQDYIDPAMTLTNGYAAVISIEPDPDDSPDPFTLKPLMDGDIEDVGPAVSQSLANIADGFPTATVEIIDVVSLDVSLSNLPNLGTDYVYEGWLAGHGVISTGLFKINAHGMLKPDMVYVETNEALNAAKFVLSIEPVHDYDPGPSDTKILAGTLEDGMTDLTIHDPAALNTDFASAMGGFILETPSTSESDDYNQGIWFLDPSAGPGASLDLPDLPKGWIYEGWVAGPDGPVTTGRFLYADAHDRDLGGPYAGPNTVPPFPGQDFIDPPMILTDGYAAIISVEPEPDNSPDPFVIKPLINSSIEDSGPGVLQTLDNVVENLPSGTVSIGTGGIPTKNFELRMSDTDITAGDVFHLHYLLHNPELTAYQADVWIILEAFGDMFLYPSWVNIKDGIDYSAGVTVDPISSYHYSALLFIWPEDVTGSAMLRFYGAAFESGSYSFIGDIEVIEFQYH